MPNLKISELTAGVAVTGPEEVAAVQSSASVKLTADQLKTFSQDFGFVDDRIPFSSGGNLTVDGKLRFSTVGQGQLNVGTGGGLDGINFSRNDTLTSSIQVRNDGTGLARLYANARFGEARVHINRGDGGDRSMTYHTRGPSDGTQVLEWAVGMFPSPGSMNTAMSWRNNLGNNSLMTLTQSGNLRVGAAGSAPIARFEVIGGGSVFGAPTGLNQGAGTINAEKIFNQGIQGGFATKTNHIVNYTTTALDHIVAVTDTTSPRTITLGNATLAQGTSSQARFITIKDQSGGATSNNITIDTEGGGTTIDGAASITITVNYGVAVMYCDGTEWFTL